MRNREDKAVDKLIAGQRQRRENKLRRVLRQENHQREGFRGAQADRATSLILIILYL